MVGGAMGGRGVGGAMGGKGGFDGGKGAKGGGVPLTRSRSIYVGNLPQGVTLPEISELVRPHTALTARKLTMGGPFLPPAPPCLVLCRT